MKLLTFAFPSASDIQGALRATLDDVAPDLKVIESYFSGTSIGMDGEDKVRGLAIYGYNDVANDEYTYMVIGWTLHNGQEYHVDEYFLFDSSAGFDTIDEAEEFLYKHVNCVKIVY
ncbi:hypothetical protein Acj9p043 [Acinetobacter phage Acj9]|uniref:Uncharacterized protein n=1 Tax=Acinetobacter phage Acj9 TaxID=760939 RepID=E5EPH7_9CAUD|nr:hypothetical protein Acj9p043 [Acinetobacter phage Acj9]ADG59943.1 hypothetical protein Acj9p043 [Acinetobacter phage Acj9]